MKGTAVSLPDDIAQALDREVQRRRSSASEITREALAQHLRLAGGPRELPFAALGHSGPQDHGARHGQLLEHEWDDDARRR
jgi:predicted transcriptional regulator